MTRPVRIAQVASTPASTVAVNRLHDVGNRVIVVHPTPGRGGEGIARDVLQALGKRFRDRTPRDPQRLQALAGIWLHAELARELVVSAADRRPAGDWRVLRDLCRETLARLTLVVERRPSCDQINALGDDVRELTLSELVYELPPSRSPDRWGIFDESGSPDERPGYPPVPDFDFAYFPSASIDLLPEDDAERVLRAFDRARAATMLWFELRRGIEDRHGPSPRHAHAFLDTLVAPCTTVDGAITMLRGARPVSCSAPSSRSTRTCSRLITGRMPARRRPTRRRRCCAATQSRTSRPPVRSRPQHGRTLTRSPG